MGSVKSVGCFILMLIVPRVAKALERLKCMVLANEGMPRALNMINLDQGDPWTELNY